MGNFCGGGISVVADAQQEAGAVRSQEKRHLASTPEPLSQEQKERAAVLKVQSWIRALRALRYLREGHYVRERQVRDAQLVYVERHEDAEDGSTYRGQVIKEGEPPIRQGYGESFWPDDRHYLGFWHRNKFHGFGYLKQPDSSYYQGYFKEGLMYGYGTRRNTDQIQGYTGWWANEVYEGFGTEVTIINGITYTYEGEWKNCMREGFGHLTIDQEFSYVGDFVDDEFSGHGLMRFNHSGLGCLYLGDTKNNVKEGHGVFVRGEAELPQQAYSGEWRQDRREGRGVVIRADGMLAQVGEWRAGELEGLVLEVPLPEGEVRVAIFKKDRKVMQTDQTGPQTVKVEKEERVVSDHMISEARVEVANARKEIQYLREEAWDVYMRRIETMKAKSESTRQELYPTRPFEGLERPGELLPTREEVVVAEEGQAAPPEAQTDVAPPELQGERAAYEAEPDSEQKVASELEQLPVQPN